MKRIFKLVFVAGVFAAGILALLSIGSEDEPVQASRSSAPGTASTVYLPIIALAPTPTPTPTPPPPPPPADWLVYLNSVRGLGNLPQVTANAAWSADAYNHSAYVVQYDDWASFAYGILTGDYQFRTDRWAIDQWIVAPFHGIQMIDSRLTQTGFGSYRQSKSGIQMAATLDVLRGRSGSPLPGVSYPVMWPANNKTVSYTYYPGGEYPDPGTHCAGYGGMPIYLQLGPGNVTPGMQDAALWHDGQRLDTCWFDENVYWNPDDTARDLGRSILHERSAVILMPREALTPGWGYTVQFVNNGILYSWYFTVSDAAATAPQKPAGAIR